jgi:hypothetical protein
MLGVLAVAAVLAPRLISDSEPTAQPRTLSAGDLSVQAPAGWTTTNVAKGPLASLSGSVAAAPAGRSDISLTAGLIREPATTEHRLQELSGEGADGTAARLGRLQVSRYDGLRLQSGTTGTAYLLHTTGPSILLVCQAPAAGGRGDLAACASAASTVRLRGARPVAPEVAEQRLRSVLAALSRLNADRLAARRRIAAALVAEDQASATRGLQASYEKAWGRVLDVGMPGTEAAQLLTGLGDAAAAYGALATAISVGDQPGYDEARADVSQAEEIVSGASVKLAH